MPHDAPEPDDLLAFADEGAAEAPKEAAPPWPLLIVDDEEEVHNVTRLVLDQFEFGARPLEFISAYSGSEAIDHLRRRPDIAVVLLDVVMETEDAGLQVARRLREELNNALPRIVLRTGQPGHAPEDKVILDYDINDYKAKTELTATKLFTTIVAALRGYRDLTRLETNRRGLESIVRASSSLFELKAIERFFDGVLTQLTSLLRLKEDAFYGHASGFAASVNEDDMRIVAATGSYADYLGRPMQECVPPQVFEHLERARRGEAVSELDEDHYFGYFRAETGSENVLYLQGWRGLSEWDRYLIEVFCANVAIAHDNLNLNSEIIETQREIILKLGEVVETRSRETGNHVKRVAEYCGLLAEAYGLKKDEVTVLKFASPMHDLGKMAIPDSILKKPGKLTPEEFDQMKTHTRIGHDLLRNSRRTLLKAAAIVALQHHERYDGTGYPQGLAGEDIHIFGRITAVADVYDALGVRRVYKEAWPLDRILEYFHEQRGKHFDPKVVDLFLELLDDFHLIRQQYPDVIDSA